MTPLLVSLNEYVWTAAGDASYERHVPVGAFFVDDDVTRLRLSLPRRDAIVILGHPVGVLVS